MSTPTTVLGASLVHFLCRPDLYLCITKRDGSERQRQEAYCYSEIKRVWNCVRDGNTRRAWKCMLGHEIVNRVEKFV